MSRNAKPVIGVISCNRPIEGEEGYTVKRRYVDAVALYADAVPLIIPSLPDAADAAAMIKRLDAVLLTGSSSNIEGHRYGVPGGRDPFDPKRDAMAMGIIAAAGETGKPVFGVCRGLQEINVALGGTLRDQRDGPGGSVEHHAPDGVALEAIFGHCHRVETVPGTPLAAIMGTAPIGINSVHYQAIDKLAEGLTVNARAEDGVVEAVSRGGPAPILAVQWHPEWQPEERAHDLAFWREVGRLARG